MVEEVEVFLGIYQGQCETGYPPLVYMTDLPRQAASGGGPAAPPAVSVAPGLPFKYYLHDNEDGEAHSATIQAQLTGPLANMDQEEFGEFIGQDFYEITLECTLDPATGTVTILKAYR